MNKSVKAIFVTVLSLGILSGCARLQPVYNVQEPLTSSKVSSAEVGKIISKASVAEGWKVKSTGANSYRVTTSWREHTAAANITYSAKKYTIQLAGSENLLEGKGMIHRKYNERVKSLQNRIDHDLHAAGVK